MSDYAYYNGVFTPYSAAAIPLSDRSLFFGEAIYDIMIGRGGYIHEFDKHMRRLRSGASRIGLPLCIGDGELLEISRRLIELSGHREYTVYIQVSGYGERRSHENTSDRCNLLIAVCKFKAPEATEDVRLIVLPDKRYSYCDIKTVCLLPAVLSVREAREKGAEMAVFIRDGHITECSSANIFIYKDGVLRTPPRSAYILPGIVRERVLLLAEELGLPTAEEDILPEELPFADEIIVTSTTHLVRRGVLIGGEDGGSRELADMLHSRLYEEYLSLSLEQ